MATFKWTKKTLLIINIIMVSSLLGCINKESKNNELKTLNTLNLYSKDEEAEFYIASDIHFLDKSLYDNGESFNKYIASGDGKELLYIEEITNSLFEKIKETSPNFLIISGDLTNNGEKLSHLSLAKKLKEVEANGTKVYVIPGNHDISNPWALKFSGDKREKVESISSTEFNDIYKDFGYDEAISRDSASLSYLIAPTENTWLLMLDTNIYENNSKSPNAKGLIRDETIKWINECINLASGKGANLISVTHHNIISQSKLFGKYYTVENSDEILKLFTENNIKTNLSGHIHIQNIASANIDNKNINDIASSSLSIYPFNYGVLKYSPEDNEYKYHASSLDVEGFANSKGINTYPLNDFREYSRNNFKEKCYGMALLELETLTNYTPEQKQEMLNTLNLINDNNIDNISHSPGFKLWMDYGSEFFKGFYHCATNNMFLEEATLNFKYEP